MARFRTQVTEGASPLQTLGGLFHDVVYYQPDGGLTQAQWELVNSPTRAIDVHDDDRVTVGASAGGALDGEGGAAGAHSSEEGGDGGVADSAGLVGDSDPMLQMVAGVFGLEAGQEISVTTGQNEFLSAVICARCLAPVLSMAVIAQIAATIEMTIPFRGEGVALRLHRGLLAATARSGVPLSSAAADVAVAEAVSLGNRDVADFASEDPAVFLSNTWLLLPEGNWDLWKPNVYSTSCWRRAIGKVHGFYVGYIKPGNVFQSHAGVPLKDEMDRLKAHSTRNITVARVYLVLKLLAAGVLEAIAVATGGDMPVAGLMGSLDLSQEGEERRKATVGRKKPCGEARMEDFLPPPHKPLSPPEEAQGQVGDEGDVRQQLMRLVYEGRELAAPFDLKHSPLAAFLLSEMGMGSCAKALALFQEVWKAGDGELTSASAAETLLSEALSPRVSAVVTRACAAVADQRENVLATLRDKLEALSSASEGGKRNAPDATTGLPNKTIPCL